MSKLIDNKIEQFSRYLQQRNNLDHIEFLKVRLGMQVVAINFFKALVTYGVSILCHLFLYTLTVHLTYFLLGFLHMVHMRNHHFCVTCKIYCFCFITMVYRVYTNVSNNNVYTCNIGIYYSCYLCSGCNQEATYT